MVHVGQNYEKTFRLVSCKYHWYLFDVLDGNVCLCWHCPPCCLPAWSLLAQPGVSLECVHLLNVSEKKYHN